MVRAGKHGSQEATAINENLVTMAWNEMPDLSSIDTKEELENLYGKTYSDVKKMKTANHVGQIWRFIREMKKGDLVALPLKSQSAIMFGKVVGNYEYKPISENVKHIRRVSWIKPIPRTAIDQDLLYSFGAIMTVCQIKRNEAEERIGKLLEKDIMPETGTEIEPEWNFLTCIDLVWSRNMVSSIAPGGTLR